MGGLGAVHRLDPWTEIGPGGEPGPGATRVPLSYCLVLGAARPAVPGLGCGPPALGTGTT
jgi:hypothetical protein